MRKKTLVWLFGGASSSALLAACSAGSDISAFSGVPPLQGGAGGGGGAVASGGLGPGSGGVILGSTGGAPPFGASGGGGAVKPGVDAGACGRVIQKTENVRAPVDIIFGIDTSGSMMEEVAQVQQNLNAFSQQIIAANVDVHVIILASLQTGVVPGGAAVDGPCIGAPLGSGRCPDDSKPPAFVHLNAPVASWDVLDVYVNRYPEYKAHLRENSLKTFVTISDDNADSATHPIGFILPPPVHHTADSFITAVAALEPGSPMWSNWRYSGIYSFTLCPPSQFGAVGVVHADLVQKTKGVAGDLCLQNFQPVFDVLAAEVVTGSKIACDWSIPPPPNGEKLDVNNTAVQFTVNGVQEPPLPKIADGASCAGHEAWYYDNPAAPTRVFACPAMCQRVQAAKNAEVAVLFDCAPPQIIIR